MAPSRFRKDTRGKREVTPFNEANSEAELVPSKIPDQWRDIEAPINFTWVVQDELAGMGWPKSRDQVRFLVSQGIDHMITLSADKIPPHYAFPELKWTMIPVEDFTGPTIADIKKFIAIMDASRADGEVNK
jgi:protein-tyrosine phosphatase